MPDKNRPEYGQRAPRPLPLDSENDAEVGTPTAPPKPATSKAVTVFWLVILGAAALAPIVYLWRWALGLL